MIIAHQMVRVTIVADIDSQAARDIVSRIRDGIVSQNIIVTIMTIYDIQPNILNRSDCIVFGCPTLMSGPSAAFKRFMEQTMPQFYNQNYKNKLSAGFTYGTSMSGDKFTTIQSLCNFASQNSMIWIPQGNIAENEGINSNGVINSQNSYLGNISEIYINNNNTTNNFNETAYYFGRRIGTTVNRWIQ
jgi:multimeric flavodoxin WrbA